MPLSLGERMRQLRKAKRFLLEDLEERSGVTAGQISRYETGKARPSIDRLISLARALDVSTEYLIGQRRDLNRVRVPLVARREALRVFRERRTAETLSYDSVVSMPAAPTTADGWIELDNLIRRLLDEEDQRVG